MRTAILFNDYWGLGNYIRDEFKRQHADGLYLDSAKYSLTRYTNSPLNIPPLRKSIYKFFRLDIGINHKTAYFLQELGSMPQQDVIVLINPNEFSWHTLAKARKKTQNLHGVFLDSLDRAYIPQKHLSYFDKIFSFDPYDCNQHPHFIHLPNFIHASPLGAVKIADASIIMSQSIEREMALSRIVKILLKQGLHKFDFHILRHHNAPMVLDSKYYTDQKITMQDALIMAAGSAIMLDLVRSQQTGLSFRVFEALGLQKKLITDNPSIRNYDFYDPQNIFLMEKDCDDLPESFFNTPYRPVPKHILDRYNIQNWVSTILKP